MLGDKVFEKMTDQSEELITEHRDRIVKAFGKQDDGKLAVSLTFNIAPAKAMDQYDVDCSISYLMERIREKISATVTENQMELPLKPDKVYKLGKE